MRYFCQLDSNNVPYFGSVLRYREESGLIHEENWNGKLEMWESTTWLTRLLTRGDCTLVSISEGQAKKLCDAESETSV
jgi:hypothetical protein